MSEPTADAVTSLAAQVEKLTAAVGRIGGYAPEPEWTWVECDGEGLWASLAPREGAEPLRIECRADLMNYQTEAIRIAEDAPISANWPALTRYVRAWNVQAENTETGEWEDVPPPSEMGPDAFRYVRPLAQLWMAFVVKFATMREKNLPKGSPPTAGTPNSPSEPASDSSSPAKPSRTNRTGSTSSSPTASTG